MVDPASFQAVGWTLLSLAGIAVAYNQIDEAFKRRQPKPSAAEVQMSSMEKFLTMEQGKEMRALINTLFSGSLASQLRHSSLR
jgi:hypothetical protein